MTVLAYVRIARSRNGLPMMGHITEQNKLGPYGIWTKLNPAIFQDSILLKINDINYNNLFNNIFNFQEFRWDYCYYHIKLDARV